MQTKIYRDDILKMVEKIRSEKVKDNITYDFLLDNSYIGGNGKPKEALIYMQYEDFSSCIESFFNKLYIYTKKLLNNSSQEYIINLFKNAPFMIDKSKKIKRVPKIIKDDYDLFESSNHKGNIELIFKINEIKEFYNEKYIFLYDKLRDDFGAKLQKENEIFLCPYCQKNYINVIQKDSLLIKPDLDHFYPKGKYPFLAMSLDNLIPSCQTCNSRLKGEIDFYEITHLHPLKSTEKIFEKIKFNYLSNTIYLDKIIFNKQEKQYLETFRIEEVYNTHTEILDDILEKNKKYNYVKKNHILKTCPSMGMGIIKKLVFHEYIHIDEKKVPMSSLKKSLFKKIVGA